MPISGLAITLSSDPAGRDAALAAMQAHPAITLGARDGLRMPLVVDTTSSEADREVWQWLHDLPGVQFVDVACVHFTDEVDDDSDAPSPDQFEGSPP